jgi:hypothetical protein
LNDPVRCRFSAFIDTEVPVLSERVRELKAGVRVATASTARRACSISSSPMGDVIRDGIAANGRGGPLEDLR